jgi:thioredoxin 1
MPWSPRRFWGRVFPVLLAMALWPALADWGQAAPGAPKQKPAILEFGRGICPTCKQMTAILEQFQERYGDRVEVRQVIIDREEPLFQEYKVMLVPTQVFLDANGKEVFRHMGLFPEKDLVKKLQELKFLQANGK